MTTGIAETWLQVQGLRIHCLEAGRAGSPVLLVHGAVVDHARLSYRYAIEPLAQAHRVFVPDLPGHGQSDKPHIHYTTEYYTAFLAHLIDALGLETSSLVGVSAGAAFALGYALDAPERVDRLVMVGGYGLGCLAPYAPLSFGVVHMPVPDALLRAVLGRSRHLIRLLLRLVMHDPSAVTESLLDDLQHAIRQPRAGSAWRSWQRTETGACHLRTCFEARLRELRVPTFLLQGARDRLVPLAAVQRARRLIPEARLQVFPDRGHWLPREAPAEFNRALLHCLAYGQDQRDAGGSVGLDRQRRQCPLDRWL